MEVLYILIPIALLLVVVMLVIFFWAVKSGQFEDLEGPAWEILMDDDKDDVIRDKNSSKTITDDNSDTNSSH